MIARSRRYREPWGTCQTCGFEAPASLFRFDTKHGWQCIGAPGAACADPRPDHDELRRLRRLRLHENVRMTSAPLTNSLTEGGGTAVGPEKGYGETPYGQTPYGEGQEE